VEGVVSETLSPRSAALLIVGDEILSGDVEDQNTPFLTRRLWELGILVDKVVIVGDRREAIVDELQRLNAAHDFVIVTGGMGPTHDDVTRQAVADALGLPLEPHSEARELLSADYGERLTPSEAAMAELPQGSRVMRGRQQLAAGCGDRLDHEDAGHAPSLVSLVAAEGSYALVMPHVVGLADRGLEFEAHEDDAGEPGGTRLDGDRLGSAPAE